MVLKNTTVKSTLKKIYIYLSITAKSRHFKYDFIVYIVYLFIFCPYMNAVGNV